MQNNKTLPIYAYELVKGDIIAGQGKVLGIAIIPFTVLVYLQFDSNMQCVFFDAPDFTLFTIAVG